jgi:hypothetical protein
VTRLGPILRTVIAAFPDHRNFALVGGLAVSARAEPRFTRDIDLAVAVEDDMEAERVVFALQARGFAVAAAVEQSKMHRLATARLRQSPQAPFVDLLFASCGVEREIVGSASRLEVLGVELPVATVGHLIAMKLVSRDPKRRPRDQQDLVDLVKVAGPPDWRQAEAAIELIAQRGFSRGRDLRIGLAELRSLADE